MSTHYVPWRVAGVKNLVEACQRCGVRALVHNSTVAVKMGGARVLEHTETLTPAVPEEKLILGDYARTRLRGEEVVLAAHGTPTHTGQPLRSSKNSPLTGKVIAEP